MKINNRIVFDSDAEIRFWAACLRWGVPVWAYSGDVIDTDYGPYRPEVTVGRYRIHVDLKGWDDERYAAMRNEAARCGLRVVNVDEDILRNVENNHWPRGMHA